MHTSLLHFFKPIISKHKKIFLFLLFDAVISSIASIILPFLAKIETDQLVAKKGLVWMGYTLSGFDVFLGILFLVFGVSLIQRLFHDISQIYQTAQKEYFTNDIQLSLFHRMERMEVGKTLSSRFQSIGRILENEFDGFATMIIESPSQIIGFFIKTIGMIGLYSYFDIRLLGVVIIASVIAYFISEVQRKLRIKYEVSWKLSLGQKQWEYANLFLYHFGDLAINGSVNSVLKKYDHLLKESVRYGLKKQWSDLTWTIGGILNGNLSDLTIKAIVGYGVFLGTNSIGMVALVITSLGTIRELIDTLLHTRQSYRDFRFRGSLLKLFFHITEPIGTIEKIQKSAPSVSIKNLNFTYPNLANYELEYMELVKTHMGSVEGKWIHERFQEIIDKVESDLKKENTPILKNLSLEMKTGKVYGIVGKNGAGKTTLMHLLAGFFREYSGVISLMNDPKSQEWYPTLFAQQISFLTQVPYILGWGSTLHDNLFLGVSDPEKKEDLAWEYLEKFGLAEKIRVSKDGLNTEIGNNIEFSGGEKQIITFIRLMLQDRPIIIMDEGTNQLDAENEILVMDTLMEKKGEKIIIFITHRMSTISRADEILCLEDGKIEKSGSHSALLQDQNNAYARFYRAQILHHESIGNTHVV